MQSGTKKHKQVFFAAELSEALEARLRTGEQSIITPGILAGMLLGPEARRDLSWACLAYLLKAVFTVASPCSIFFLLRWFERSEEPPTIGWVCAAVNAAAVVGQHVAQRAFAARALRAGLRCQVAAVGSIYRRTLHLTAATSGLFKSGELTALLSADVETVAGLWSGLISIVLAPLEVVVIVLLLWVVVAEATLGALACVTISYTVSRFGGQAMERVSTDRSVVADQRLKVLTEVLYGMKVVKVNGWVPRFHDRIRGMAIQESKLALWKKRIMSQVVIWSNEMVDIMAFTTAVLAVLACGQVPSAANLFTMWVFMGVLHGKIFTFPESVRSVSTAWSSLRRIAVFLSATAGQGAAAAPRFQQAPDKFAVDNGTFSFIDSDANLLSEASIVVSTEALFNEKLITVLRNVSVSVQVGRMYAVVGEVGAGKTSLLLGLMGEMHVSSSTSLLRPIGRDRVAYVPQDPVVFNDTVRANVCFTRPFSQERFDSVCSACALDHDLGRFPEGDLTMIGSRGINISGGQQARICLARAVYADADLYVLDDPLAKLDVRVAEEVFSGAIVNALAGKTRFMTCTSRQLARRCDGMIAVVDNSAKVADNADGSGDGTQPPQSIEVKDVSQKRALPEDDDVGGHDALVASIVPASSDTSKPNLCRSALVFFRHLVAGVDSPWIFCWHVFIMTLEVVVIEFGVYTLVMLSDDPLEQEHSHEWYCGVYAIFISLEIIIAQVKLHILAGFTQRSCDRLHDSLLTCVMQSSLMWLQSVPVGQVLQLFSGTLGLVEEHVFIATELFGEGVCFCGAISVVVCIGFPPFVVLLLLVAAAIYATVRSLGVEDAVQASAAQLRRGCLQHYIETLSGLVVVRAFDGAMGKFQDQFDELVSDYACVQLASAEAVEGNRMRVNIVGTSFYALSTAVLVVARDHWDMTPGIAGFILTNSCFFSVLLSLMVDQALALLNVSRERAVVEQIVLAVPRERNIERGPASTELAKLCSPGGDEPRWPWKGALSIQNLEIRYRPTLPPALRGLTLEVAGGEHLGVVGRSGSGKSSLLLSLARLVEASGGRITLDGVDLAHVGLAEFRPHLGVLSQDPLFFSGSLRENLDPFSEHADDALVAAVGDVGLTSFLRDQGLGAAVSELGGNLSMGQRQLLCLARAALRQPRLVLVDEATAALDATADERVQLVLNERFGARGATVVQVAHRLWSVARCDRVLVLEDGAMVELGTPKALLTAQNVGSQPRSPSSASFRAMVDGLGGAEADALRRIVGVEVSSLATQDVAQVNIREVEVGQGVANNFAYELSI